MSNQNIELIEKTYESFGNRDYEAVIARFADDFEWIAADNSPLADQSPYHGIYAVRTGVFERIAAGFEKLRVEADEMFEAEGRVVVLGYYHGQFRGKEHEFRTQVAHIWTLRDGKAVKFQQYLDTLKVSQDAAAD
ncbi:MAG: nuclear transport factor 2 family protein [Saprospiraceae bacterium]|nr:nuclear transport factor 2 family protein [Pyrinomonadaceae bacterium]